MAASGWRYIVPHQTDMEQVLDDLRRDVLMRGDYEEPAPDIDFLDEVGFFEADEGIRELMMAEFNLEPLLWAIQRFGVDGLRGWLKSLESAFSPRARGPRTMEELEALQCISPGGTHSILDIYGISKEAADDAISPLPDELLVQSFGTDQPTRGMVEAWQGRDDPAGTAFYQRWRGISFTIFKDGRPDEIYIERASGD